MTLENKDADQLDFVIIQNSSLHYASTFDESKNFHKVQRNVATNVSKYLAKDKFDKKSNEVEIANIIYQLKGKVWSENFELQSPSRIYFCFPKRCCYYLLSTYGK